VGSEQEDLEDAANGALLDEFGGAPGGFDVEAFAVIDEVFAAGAAGEFAGGGELVEGGEGAFVGEVILAGFEDAAADGPAFAGDGGGGDEVNERGRRGCGRRNRRGWRRGIF
jgi:hypothetical protein